MQFFLPHSVHSMHFNEEDAMVHSKWKRNHTFIWPICKWLYTTLFQNKMISYSRVSSQICLKCRQWWMAMYNKKHLKISDHNICTIKQHLIKNTLRMTTLQSPGYLGFFNISSPQLAISGITYTSVWYFAEHWHIIK